MEKYIPYEKLSKKEKRKLNLARRGTWGEINPVTRKPANSKAYNRKRTQDWKKELPFPASRLFFPAPLSAVKQPPPSPCRKAGEPMIK